MNYKQIKDYFTNYQRYILSSKDYMISSVLIPLVEIEEELNIVFQVRSSTLNTQPNEVSFPGGKLEESDKSPLETALRETNEEFGLSNDKIDIVSELDLLVSPFGVIIHSFLGKISSIADITINSDEVDSFFTVPISFLVNYTPEEHVNSLIPNFDENFPFNLIPNGKDYKFRNAKHKTYFYRYKDKVIWGMTAVILENFISKLNQL
ncbi:MAG: CoA pyrophosphatase [Proteocatella sp.]